MQVRLGPFLRQLRQSRLLSQAQVAQAAGIGRVTLARWESGAQQPRSQELNAVLTALNAGHRERHQAYTLLGRPEARIYVPAAATGRDEARKIGLRPHGGEMLRALRVRRGLSQEAAATLNSITVRTLRRWEKGEIWPSALQLHTLCSVLGAHPQEMWALTTRGVSFEPTTHDISREEIIDRCDVLVHYPFQTGDVQGAELRELGFFALEMQTWPLAEQSLEGQRLLSWVYSCHAAYYCAFERYAEGYQYASRALDTFPSVLAPDDAAIQAGILSAMSAVYRSNVPAPHRGIEILCHWLNETEQNEYKAWMLSDMAKYTALTGNLGKSQFLAEQASAIATHCESKYELFMRELDEADILLQANNPIQALALLERDSEVVSKLEPSHTVKFRLSEAQAYLALKNPSTAQERLQDAFDLMDHWPLEYLRPRAQALALHL